MAKPKRAVGIPTVKLWTADKRATFLAALAELANVAAAARLAGVPETSPYKLKLIDAKFAEAWEAAIDEGYNRLELLLLRRATYGEQADGEDAPTISTTLALGLLKARQTIARRGPPKLPVPMYGEELRTELRARLATLKNDG
ncbi:hypothetical protein [Sphingomonas sp. SUN039]|uniref:hypothetical protein n=1 Tax=Sphingomonas sp. SUN039 TaxID=2937787 RepID=UPI002164307C|nr:hypothetical protein [Sphingomonas sp. SUN039]UVO52958.1 hypothetical protein M0209_02035 [Sphingomonas sp. SUN039]